VKRTHQDPSGPKIIHQNIHRKLHKTPHRGVLLIPPDPGKPHWRYRYRDPETNRVLTKTLDALDGKTADTRTAFAVKLFKQLRRRKEEIASGSRRHVEAGLSIEDALSRYFTAHDLNPKALKVYRSAADDFQQWCNSNDVSSVRALNKAKLFEFRTWLKTAPKMVPKAGGKKGEYVASEEARSPSSVNKALRAMSAILNQLRAADVVRLSSDEIKDALKRFKAETERKSILSPKSIHALLKEMNKEPFAALVRCMLLTGIRLEEALLIEWRDVEDHVLRIRAAVGKGGKKRDVDLEVAPTAFGKRGDDQERCFPFTFAEVRGAYERSRTKWTPHALRRTWSSYFVAAFGPWRASKSAGHGILVMQASYADLVKVPEGVSTLEQAIGI
jgi:integrase